MPVGNRQDTATVTASVQLADGTWLRLGVFQDRKGGASDSASTTYSMGGSSNKRRALGGRPEPTTVTISRLFDDEAQAWEKLVRSRAGKAQMTVSEQPQDIEGNAIGDPLTWAGVLKNVHKLDYNAESTTAQTIELEMVTESIT